MSITGKMDGSWAVAMTIGLALMAAIFSSVQTRAIGKSSDDLEGLEDTLVHLGDETVSDEPRGLRVRRAPSALREIMTSLSRNKRQVPELVRSQEVYERMKGSLLLLLQMFLGSDVRVEIKQFSNWDNTIHVRNLFYVAPTTIWQVRSVLHAAGRLGMRVRATGVGHSRSPLYVDEGNVMMDVRGLTRHDGPQMEVHKPTPEQNFDTVTVMTSVIEKDFNDFLTEHGLTMKAEPLNDVETIGGMVSTATHGATWEGQTYSGYVVEMRLLDSAGRLRRFTNDSHPEIMAAARCSLGLFGILYDITLKVFPTVKVAVRNEIVPLDSLFFNASALKEAVLSNIQTEISWFPFNSVTDEEAAEYNRTSVLPLSWTATRDKLWLRTISKASEAEVAGQTMQPSLYNPSGGSLSDGKAADLLRGREALRAIAKLPPVTYHFLAHAFPYLKPPKAGGSETSAAFLLNVDNAFERPVRALRFMVGRVEDQMRTDGSSPLNALLPRFLKSDEACLLCHGSRGIKTDDDDSGHSLVVDFLAPPDQDGYYPAAREFVERFRNETVRPHWAKRHDNVPGIIDVIHDAFGDQIPQFTRMRALARVDPCDMFMNAYLIAVFGRSENCLSF